MQGSDASVLLDIIRKTGYNREMEIEVGRVQSVSPLSIHLNKYNLTLDKDDLIVAERIIKDSPLEEGDLVILISDENSQLYYAMDKAGVIE